MARVGWDTKIFKVLSDSEDPMTCEELANKTGVDPVLMSECFSNISIVRNS
jgi:hypothetical protein